MRYAIVNENGDVINVIEWDGASEWRPPKNTYVVFAPIGDREDTYDIDNDILHRKDRRSRGPVIDEDEK